MESQPESQPESGGAKKFLYTGPKKTADEEEDLPWNFNSKNQKPAQSPQNGKFEMDSVWSIQRNVNIGGNIKSPKSDQLNFSTSKGYYSRYGGGGKEKEEFGASSVNNDKTGNSDTSGGKTWSVGNQSRRPFSYSFGTDAQTTQDKPISPRNVSNSSASVYPQTTGMPTVGSLNGSLTCRPAMNSGSTMNSGNALHSGNAMNSGNHQTSFRGGNSNSNSQVRPSFLDSNSSGNSNNNNNNNTVNNRPLNSQVANVGVSHSYKAAPRNSLFSSSQPKASPHNDLFGTNENWSTNTKSTFGSGSSTRQNKSFW